MNVNTQVRRQTLPWKERKSKLLENERDLILGASTTTLQMHTRVHPERILLAAASCPPAQNSSPLKLQDSPCLPVTHFCAGVSAIQMSDFSNF